MQHQRDADVSSVASLPSTTASAVDRALLAMDSSRNQLAPAFATRRPTTAPRRVGHCIAPETVAINERLSAVYDGVIPSGDGFSVTPRTHVGRGGPESANGAKRGGAADATATFLTANSDADRDDAGAADARVASGAAAKRSTPRRPVPPPRGGGSATAASRRPITAASRPRKAGQVSPDGVMAGTSPPPAGPVSAYDGVVSDGTAALAPAKRVDALLDAYRSDENRRRGLEHRLHHYRKVQIEEKRSGVRPGSARRPPPPTPPPPRTTASPSGGGGGDGSHGGMYGSSEQTVLSEADAADAAAQKLDRGRCEHWLEVKRSLVPTVELRPTPDEIRAANAERERLHKHRAIVAAAEVRMRKERATTEARRAAHRSKAAAAVSQQEAIQRVMEWSTNVVLAVQMQRVWFRLAAMVQLANRANDVVILRRRVFACWSKPALAARQRAKRRMSRARWFFAIVTVRLAARLAVRRRQVVVIGSYLKAARSLGSMCIAVRHFHRRVVICQRTVRKYIELRLWRLQLLHLQWDIAEDCMQRRMAETTDLAAAGIGSASHAMSGSAGGDLDDGSRRRSTRKAKASKGEKATERKNRALAMVSGMTDEEKVRVLVDNDARTGAFFRRTPFLLRHRAIVKFWTQQRRGVARRLVAFERGLESSSVFGSPTAAGSPRFRKAEIASVIKGAKAAAAMGAFEELAPAASVNFATSIGPSSDVGSMQDTAEINIAVPSSPKLPKAPRMPLLIPHDRLERMVRFAVEEFAGVCREHAMSAARNVVIAKADPAQYPAMRDAMIDSQFSESRVQEAGFNNSARVRTGALVLSEYGARTRRQSVAPVRPTLPSAVELEGTSGGRHPRGGRGSPGRRHTRTQK